MKHPFGSSETTTAPLSAAWEANGLVFVSGQIHADKDWKLVGASVEERFQATMKRIEDILEEARLGIQDIVHVRLFLTDLKELPVLNEEYKKYFSHPLPARTALGVTALPLGASLEIEVVAAR